MTKSDEMRPGFTSSLSIDGTWTLQKSSPFNYLFLDNCFWTFCHFSLNTRKNYSFYRYYLDYCFFDRNPFTRKEKINPPKVDLFFCIFKEL